MDGQGWRIEVGDDLLERCGLIPGLGEDLADLR